MRLRGLEHQLLEAIADPAHPRHDELAEWLPTGYDPSNFDPAEANKDMRASRPLADGWW